MVLWEGTGHNTWPVLYLKRFCISPISTMRLRGVDHANSCVVLKIALLYMQLLLKPPTLAAGFATFTSMSPVDHCPEIRGVTSRALASSERNRQSSSLHVAKISEGVDNPYREGGGSGPDDRVVARFSSSSSGGGGRGDRFDSFANFLLETQEAICREAEASDGIGRFCSDRWERDSPSESFGITRVLEGGRLLEKAACSVSVIRGVLSPERAKAMSSRGRANVDPDGGQSYSVASMSLVFHTASPLVPTFRADVRYMEVAGEGWFGGGADLTPYYLNDGDVEGFHRFYKDICDRYDAQAYPRFKKWADEYFYIPARKEHRGVGGIFFDDLECLGEGGQGKDVEAFVRDVALGFMPSFLPIAERRGQEVFTDVQRQWQLERRGRYLEFNLLYDRGVKFGLSGGRVEAIMVSAPPLVAWRYNRVPEKGSEEDRLLRVLREPREWV